LVIRSKELSIDDTPGGDASQGVDVAQRVKELTRLIEELETRRLA